MASLEIARNAQGKTNCREFYFNDYEIAEYIEDTFSRRRYTRYLQAIRKWGICSNQRNLW